jgi:hypothetical protein
MGSHVRQYANSIPMKKNAVAGDSPAEMEQKLRMAVTLITNTTKTKVKRSF